MNIKYLLLISLLLLLAGAAVFFLNDPKDIAADIKNTEPVTRAENTSWVKDGYFLTDEGVLIGQDGWLFSNAEVTFVDDFEQAVKSNQDFILATAKKLSADKAQLLIVLIPSRARIFQDKLGGFKFPAYWPTLYQDQVDFFKNNNIVTVDLLSPFEKNRMDNLYLKTDSYWAPEGARLAAAYIESAVAYSFPYTGWAAKSYFSERGGEITYEGDLLKAINNIDNVATFGLQPDRYHQWLATPDKEQDDISPSVTLVGSGNSASKLSNFEGFLQSVLITDIQVAAQEGQSPFTAMEAYLAGDDYQKTPPRLVIWEIPERYMGVLRK